jgi:hypothetical protein
MLGRVYIKFYLTVAFSLVLCWALLWAQDTFTTRVVPASHPPALSSATHHHVRGLGLSKRSRVLKIQENFLSQKRWVPYNPCILGIPDMVWKKLCYKILGETSPECFRERRVMAISLFTRKPGDPYGSTVWIGVAEWKSILSALDGKGALQWIIAPQFVTQIMGPKAADPRLTLVRHSQSHQVFLSMIAYSSLGEKSQIKGMRDYHVRFGVFGTEASEKRPSCRTIPCSDQQKQIREHFSMNCSFDSRHCNDGLELYGVEVPFHPFRHLPHKNVQPVQMMQLRTSLLFAYDFSPPENYAPLLYGFDIHGSLVFREQMELDGDSSCKDLFLESNDSRWRGSTPIVPIPSKKHLWITIVHKRLKLRTYQHRFLVLESVQVKSKGEELSLPLKCSFFPQVEVFEKTSGFSFAVGLVPADILGTEYLVSFGKNNNEALIQRIHLRFLEKSGEQLAKARVAKDPYSSIHTHSVPGTQFFLLFVENGSFKKSRILQFSRCISSIHYHYPGAVIHFFTKTPNSFETELLSLVPYVNIIHFSVKSLLQGTPAERHAKKGGWKELSDMLRLAILWRWGGSWIDVDDVMIRPLSLQQNLLPYLEWPGTKEKNYWGTNFNLIHPKWKSVMSRDRTMWFHIQNDPL